jgi:hypothetical protein
VVPGATKNTSHAPFGHATSPARFQELYSTTTTSTVVSLSALIAKDSKVGKAGSCMHVFRALWTRFQTRPSDLTF